MVMFIIQVTVGQTLLCSIAVDGGRNNISITVE